jgi:hypothetical protein
MTTNNIILIILALIIIGFAVYIYYNYKKTNINNIDDILVSTKNNNIKKVRFNNDIKIDNYNKKSSNKYLSSASSPLGIPLIDMTSNNKKIDVDRILSTSPTGIVLSSSANNSSEENQIDLISNNSTSCSSIEKFSENNFNDREASWDTNFGLPLMSKEEKKKFVSKMQKNHKDYQKSLGKFVKYQTDDNTVIKTDITIDPFKPEKSKESFKGKLIRDIYDEQVVGPKAKNKKIKFRTPESIVYEHETEMNGGKIKGTNLCGFDGIKNDFKSAAFDSEF